ncbi:Protein of unknown function DUF58 [Ferrimonas sediminum]|uniref:DUF58 domain-containing protein n=1 Tax=Ferrimonas sediminum TaxID=718193 RepID=A0A1G8LA03_9GAMM|nr:DUF58 domain-containing protein [Ferrimonas sediminum]SDI52472.1 Protein of unknown function DUF58 [Ferrimonas sediminum]
MVSLPTHSNGIDVSLEELLIYRGPAARNNPFKGLPRTSHRAGQNLSRIKGRGMEFDEVRRYQSGDDVRTIDWRVTARTGHAHTKLFREERERPVLLFVDLGNRLHCGSALLLQSVQACHLAAMLGWQSINAGERLGGIICREGGHREHKPRARRQGIAPLLDSLVELHRAEQQSEPQYLDTGLNRLRRLAHPGSVVLVISDGLGFNDHHLDILAEMARHSEIRLFQITDPLSKRLAQLNADAVLPVWYQGKLTTLNHTGRQQWLQQLEQEQQHFVQGSRQRGLARSQVDAAIPLTEQLETLWHPIR